ncbi:unnamed protein product [Mytilus coruscus]|uniref:Uncharacterized protein n=1 Tax=Mytilus coruscus TaxID=42192 RepID=A0A6J8C2E6_MYTCO|nr:unnamed protein product [Mytilus coruscus]
MASNENKTQNFSLDQLWGMKCSKLKEINKSASGTKQILVPRCYALNPVVDDREITAERSDRDTDIEDTFNPPCNFHQVYLYLVKRTKKYGDSVMKGDSYKKIKSYQFFQEGDIKSYEIEHGHGLVCVKCKVIASMKHELYRVIIVCKENGDIFMVLVSAQQGDLFLKYFFIDKCAELIYFTSTK